jgi:hypothetical protein
MNRRLLLLLVCLAAAGCGGRYAVVRGPQAARVPPRIERLEDLGALALRAGRLDATDRDGRFTPGEWVAVVGRGLHEAELSLGGARLEIGAYLDGGSVAVRLPPDLAPERGHRLVARSALGEAEARLDSAVYVIGSDTDGNAIRFLRVGAGGRDRVDDPELSVPQAATLYHALSPDAGLLYALGLPGKKAGGDGVEYDAEVAVVHLGAAGRPERVGAVGFRLASHPSGVAVTGRGVLLVLATRELLAFSLADPIRPRQVSRIELSSDPGDRWTDLAVLDAGASVAVLDASHNRVRAISLADPGAPTTLSELALGPEGDVPLSVDLAADPADPSALVVLQGRNLRTIGAKTKGAASSLAGKAVGLVRGRKADDAPPTRDAGSTARGRLAGVRLAGGALVRTVDVALPHDFIPLFCAPGGDGRFLVSGVSPGALDTGALDVSLDAAGRVLRFLKDSVQLGKILSVGRDGSSSVELQGVGLVFDVDVLPRGELVYSGMRLSGKPLPPFVTVKWGVGVGGTGFYGLHSVDDDYFLPPYTYGQVSVQRGTR